MTDKWIVSVDTADVPDDDVIGVDVAGLDIALYQTGGGYYATDNICTHGRAKLCDGFLDGFIIECPLHQGTFDIRTGKALTVPVTEDIKAYPTKIQDGKLYIRVDDC